MFHIIKRWVCHAIYGIGLIVICMREGYEGRVRGHMGSYCIECSYCSSSEACVIIKLAIFSGLSGVDASVSIEKSNHVSSQAVSKSVHSVANYHCVPLFMKFVNNYPVRMRKG